MAQDPIRARKADRWDQLTQGGMSPAEATAQVEREFAGQTAAPQEQPAARQPTRQPEAAQKPKLTGMEEAKGLGRSIARGALFGFGEELESLPYMLPGGESREDALKRIRGEMEKYSEARPVLSTAAEIGGGFLTGGPTGSLRSAAGTGLRAAVRRGAATAAGRGAIEGALGGIGESEGGVPGMIGGAVMGGTAGAATGGLAGRFLGKRAATQARGGPPDVGAQFVKQAMETAGARPGPLRAEAQRMATIAPETRMADLLGEVGQRSARGQAGFGGRPGTQVAEAMQQRYAERPGRMQDILTRTTGAAPEDAYKTLDEFRAYRKEAADPLYQRAYANPPIVDPALEAMIDARPALKQAEMMARQSLANRGITVAMMDAPGGSVPVRTPEYLDYMKGALDDMIYKGKRPTEGGLGLREIADIEKARQDFLGVLDDKIPGYREARAAYAGDTALIQAMESGMAAFNKKPDARVLAKELDLMGDSEREMFQRGYIDAIRQRIDEDKLKPAEIRAPAFGKRLETVFGDKAADVQEALAAELRIMETAGAVKAGARTAPMQIDIAEAAEPATRFGRAMMTARAIKQDPFAAGARGFDLLAEPFSAAAREGRRAQRTSALLTPAADVGPLLDKVQREYMAEQARREMSGRAGARAGRIAGQKATGALF